MVKKSRQLKKRPKRKLGVESLENRRLLATDISWDGPAEPIPDNTTTEFAITNVQALVVADLNVSLNISHGRDADLDIYLRSPDNIRVKLFDDVGGNGDNFTNTVLDDEANSSITSGSAPFTGSYSPEASLSAFDGARPAGTWTLEITDDRNRIAGTLNSWSMQVEEAGYEVAIADATATEGASAAFVDDFVKASAGGLAGGHHLVFAPNGDLLVASGATDNVLRYDGGTGEYIGEFVSVADGGLDNPHGIAFGPDGNFYVGSKIGDEILRYNGTTGQFIDAFVPLAQNGGLDKPHDVVFGPDGNLYVPGLLSHNVIRYDGQTGAYMDTFVTTASGGLDNPSSITFGPTGDLYVSTSGSTSLAGSILRYDGTTGEFKEVFVAPGDGGLDNPRQMEFREDGLLYVASAGSDSVLRFDGTTGAFHDELISPGMGGLDAPIGLTFDSNGSLYVVSQQSFEVLRFVLDSNAVFHVSLSQPLEIPLTIDFSTADGSAYSDGDYAETIGSVVVPAGQTSVPIIVPVSDDEIAETTEQFTLNISTTNSEVEITDSVGSGTIIDDDASYITISDDESQEGGQQAKVLDTFVAEKSGGLSRPRTGTFGPDGHYYVPSADTDEILRYDGTTGAFMDVFVNSDDNDLDDPLHLVFSPTENHLYVSSLGTQNKVFRFNATTGAFIDVPVPSATFPMGMTVDSGGNVYVADRDADAILKFDGTDVTTFIDSSSGLDGPRHVELGPSFDGSGDDDLYVASTGNKKILAYRTNGTLAGEFATVPFDSGPSWLDFDSSGDLYATGRPTSQCCDVSVIRYTASGSEVITNLDADGWSFVVGPDDLLYQSGNGSGNYVRRLTENSNAVFTVSLSQPSDATITVNFTTLDGSATGGVDNNDDFETMSGTLTFAPGETSKTVIVPVFDDTYSESDETFEVQISNATGDGLILDDLGQSTISDDDSNNPNALYVDDISFQAGNGGRYRAVFVVRRDSNASGTADSGDVVVSGVDMTVTFGGTTFTGTTDSNGVFRTNWVKNLGSGNHYANVVDMVLSGYVYDPLDLDNEDDSDGDGKADDVLNL